MMYLVSSASMDDGLDENAQVLTSLSRFVALQADSKAGGTRLVQWDFIHQLLPAVLQHQISSIFTFLKERGRRTAEAPVYE